MRPSADETGARVPVTQAEMSHHPPPSDPPEHPSWPSADSDSSGSDSCPPDALRCRGKGPGGHDAQTPESYTTIGDLLLACGKPASAMEAAKVEKWRRDRALSGSAKDAKFVAYFLAMRQPCERQGGQ